MFFQLILGAPKIKGGPPNKVCSSIYRAVKISAAVLSLLNQSINTFQCHTGQLSGSGGKSTGFGSTTSTPEIAGSIPVTDCCRGVWKG